MRGACVWPTLAGITGNIPTNKDDVKAQTAELLARVGRTLKAAGFDWSNVVDGVVFLPDMTTFQEMNAAYRQVFTKDSPARATRRRPDGRGRGGGDHVHGGEVVTQSRLR